MTANPSHPKPLIPIVWALQEAKRRGYSPTDSLILITLANRMNGELGAWPSVPALAADCRCAERHARRTLRRFEADGLIATEQGNGRGFTSRYRLLASTVNGVDQPDLFGEPPPPAKPTKPEKVPTRSKKGGLKAPLSKRKRGTQSPPLAPEKGDSLRTKRGTLSPGESTKKNPLVGRKNGLRPKTAVAVSHSNPSGRQEFDPRKALWTEGVEALRGLTGQMNGEAKRQIGRFLKLAGGDAVGVLRALEVAKVEGPYEPIPWISAAIQARASTRLSPQEELRKRWNLPTFMTPNLDPEA